MMAVLVVLVGVGVVVQTFHIFNTVSVCQKCYGTGSEKLTMAKYMCVTMLNAKQMLNALGPHAHIDADTFRKASAMCTD